MEAAIKATGIVKWFGEGEARTSALKDVSIEAYFGEMLYIVGAVRKRQDDAVKRALRDSAAGFGQRLRGSGGHLESQQR
jgi:hypothetical protein